MEDWNTVKETLFDSKILSRRADSLKAKCPQTFSTNYPEISFEVITKENYTDFVAEL